MIRDCSYHAETARIYEALAEIMAKLEWWEAVYEEQLNEARRLGKAWTDPRNGITYFFQRSTR